MRPWTVATRHALMRARISLQWGHGLAAVDGAYGLGAVAWERQLQWGHGLAAVDGV